ncbi:MAG TPA: FecR domain-containing protein [Bryobacteraceae bacterium]|nr:FecR domain-containing protein [Bryobacteraceae bacterium]
MSRVSVYVFSLAAGAALAVSAYGQAVISTRSGLVHFFEGNVTVAGQPLEQHFGKFASIPEGAELRTGQGRAEILLTPGVFLRVGEQSAIRMAATALTDTKVELLAGSAMLESGDAAPGTSVTLLYKNWTVRQDHQGSYRIDSDPPRVSVRGGSVVVAAAGDAPVTVAEGNDLPLEAVLAPEKTPETETHDALSQWADGRAQSISADNAISADIQDPAAVSGNYTPADAFTYFPLLGYPSMVTSAGAYGGVSPYQSPLYGTTLYQPGFYSLYLPGYTYRPLLLGVHGLGLTPGIGAGIGAGIGRSPYYSPIRIGPGTGLTTPRYPVTRPITPPPMARPAPMIHPIGHK